MEFGEARGLESLIVYSRSGLRATGSPEGPLQFGLARDPGFRGFYAVRVGVQGGVPLYQVKFGWACIAGFKG